MRPTGVSMTDNNKPLAPPSAEAAQPVAWRRAAKNENAFFDVTLDKSVAELWMHWGQVVEPLYALSQPQEELREALDALHFVSKDPAYSALRNTTRGFVNAALAGRAAK